MNTIILSRINEIWQPLNVSPPVTCEDEQAFFERHYETLRPLRRPDGTSKTRGGGSSTRPSVVGPIDMSQATIDLMEEDDSGRLSRLGKVEKGR